MKFNNDMLKRVWYQVKLWFNLSLLGVEMVVLPPEEDPDNSKLQSFSYLDMISTWVAFNFSHENLIVLTNLNLSAKNLQFWSKVPEDSIKHFNNDIVVLYCKDKSQVSNLVLNITSDFAEAYGFCSGELIVSNMEDSIV